MALRRHLDGRIDPEIPARSRRIGDGGTRTDSASLDSSGPIYRLAFLCLVTFSRDSLEVSLIYILIYKSNRVSSRFAYACTALWKFRQKFIRRQSRT